MLSILFTGMALCEAEEHVDRRNQPFVTIRMTALDAEGAAVQVSVVTFSRQAAEALRSVKVGDEIAIAGHASVNRWTDANGGTQVGLNVKARRVMTIADAGPHWTPNQRAAEA